MTTSDRVIFLLVISLVTLLSVTSATPRDDTKVRARSSGGKGQSRLRRATLHELLKKRGNLASSGASDGEVTPNENRRVLVLGDADDAPNYVYDDEDYGADNINNAGGGLDADFYDSDPHRKDAGFADVGDNVTDYASHFAVADAPSYADPELLAAVMNQADEANFQYPIPGERRIISVKDQTKSGSAKVETASDAQINNLNPFELFPPAFHELLEIPIHTYANGSTYNPHDKHKARPRRPIISRGYASTKVNGQSTGPSKDKERKNVFDSKRIQTRRRKPSFNLRSNEKKYLESVSTTTEIPTTPLTPTHRRNLYSSKDETQRLPPPGSNARRRRPVRPSLRFRTTVPTEETTVAAITTTTIATTTTTTTTETPRTSTTSREGIAVTQSPTTRRSYKPISRRVRPTRRPIDQNVVVKRRKKPSYHNIGRPDSTRSDNIQEIISQRPKLEAPIHRSKESFDVPLNSDNKGIAQRPTLKEFKPPQYLPANTKNVVEEEQLKVYEVPSRNDQSFQEKSHPEILKFEPPTVSRDTYKFGNKETSFQNKKPIKSTFKPSKIDPFVGRYPSYTPLSKLSPNKIQHIITTTTTRPTQKPFIHSFDQVAPTTYRPSYSSNVLPPVINTYPRPELDIRGNVYDDYDSQNVPFTNSHTLRRPFTNFNSHINPPRQNNYAVEEETIPVNQGHVQKAIPVFISSPFFGGAQTINEQYNRYDHHSRNTNRHQSANIYNRDSHLNNRLPPRRRAYRPVEDKRHPIVRRLPSFLQKFGLFRPRHVNRRSGISGPISDVNSIQNNEKDIKKSKVDYVLSHNPLPIDGEKVVVVGPFREPPIGAPLIYPNSQGYKVSTLQDTTAPSFDLLPPSPFKQPTAKSDTPPREPSFKVINLPNEVIDSTDTGNLKENSDTVKETQVSSTVSGNDSPTESGINAPINQASSKPVPNPYHKPVGAPSGGKIKPPIKVKHNNYHLFEEVSEADKERLIAAKFEFPREPSVRRHGLEKHVIPIPVPLLSSSGKQISEFRKLNVPHLPINRKLGSSPIRKKHQVYFVNQNSLPNNSDQKNLSLRPPVQYYKPPRRVAPKQTDSPSIPTDSPSIFASHEQPQSYREPTFDDVSFGGWQAVHGSASSDSRQENANHIGNDAQKEVGTQEKVSSIKKEQNPEEISGKQAEEKSSALPEKQLVRFSSELNVEAPEVVKSFLVEPPKKL